MNWRRAGLAALGTISVLCVGYYAVFLNQSGSPIRLAVQTAEHSQKAIEYFDGSNLRTGFVTGHIIAGPDSGNADLNIPVSSGKVRGTLLLWAQNGFAGWHVCSLVLRAKDRGDVVIVGDAKSTCERE